MELQAGELVMFPRGGAHEVAHSARGKAMPLETFLAERNGLVDLDPKAVTLICGQFNLDRHLALPALRALPQAVTLRDRAACRLSVGIFVQPRLQVGSWRLADPVPPRSAESFMTVVAQYLNRRLRSPDRRFFREAGF
jgi:hypothetical protein